MLNGQLFLEQKYVSVNVVLLAKSVTILNFLPY